MRVQRARVVAATREAVWDVVGDPYHEPRWWPKVERVEGVSRRGWTSVLVSDRGRPVRVDYTVEVSERPVRRRWRQELAGTPFERLFESYVVEVELERVDEGCSVVLAVDQRPRGFGRALPFLVRGPARRRLDLALANLAAVVEG